MILCWDEFHLCTPSRRRLEDRVFVLILRGQATLQHGVELGDSGQWLGNFPSTNEGSRMVDDS